MECTLIFGFLQDSHMKFHQNSIQDSLQFSVHVPQNSTHSSPDVRINHLPSTQQVCVLHTIIRKNYVLCTTPMIRK